MMRCEAAEARGLAANTGGVLKGELRQTNNVDTDSQHPIPLTLARYRERCR